ncbi:MAG: nucleoside monophosphate kinase [Phycisphaeraceae bacterium]|nr:nucleoside monophosphate kinase [Phycisphaeraceae bacterium]
MPDRYKSVLLFGAPGAGKGTQGRILGEIPGFYHFACGDVFRRINPRSELGRIFFEYSSRGELVPDAMTIQMWAESLHAYEVLGDYKPQTDLLILDGIPRTADQATLIEKHIEPLLVIHLKCSDREAMIERLRRRALKENRIDDADDNVIQRRWDVYERETAPVLAHYDSSLIVDVSSEGSPAQVLSQILRFVVPIQNEHFQGFEA